ncbi:MAG: glycosyltransferase family 4 protein [Tyzzerella sp.]|nr:glycosyltransferase family 4 protein [Tyzzerella sp.]
MVSIRMYSKADMAQGHGVLSAHDEQVALVKNYLSDDFEVLEYGYQQCQLNHFHTINPEFLFNAFLGKCRGTQNIGYVHFLPETLKNSISLPKPIEWLYYKYVLFFYRRMDTLVTVNPYFVDVLEKNYGFPRNKVSYIPNVVSSANFYPLSEIERKEARAEFALPKDSFIVLCAGQLQKRKGVFDFIEMAGQMPDVHFVWAGDFSFGKITQDYAKIKQVVENPPANVTFLGLVDREKMNALYNACDMMILPSYEELFPMTVLEAMQCEVPILVRQLELYDDILFDYVQYANSTEEFVACIRKLQQDKAFYRHCSKCSQTGSIEYSERNVAEKWRKFYSQFGDRGMFKKGHH